MSWLASINLDYERIARERLTDNYKWHQAAWNAFPGIKKELTATPEKRTPFLSRVKQLPQGVELLILSTIKPEKPSWCPETGWRLTEIKPDFLSHDHYLFDLYVNPTKKMKKPNNKGGVTKNGNRLAILQPSQQLEWLNKKALESGFLLSLRLKPEIIPGDQHFFSKNGKRGLHIGVRFKGLLEVCDRERFITTFHQGIGTAKGFGFGMLLIKPITI